MAKNFVYLGISIDGKIADQNGSLEWLDMIPNDEQTDMGYFKFMEGIDALVMGRNTFETVLGFDVEWPYSKPVFVASSSLSEIPEKLQDKVFIINGTPAEIVKQLNEKGYHNLYIDGGKTVQGFMAADLIDEMILTTIPTVLGGGPSLFGSLDARHDFELVSSSIHLKQIVQNHYKRKRIAE